MKEQHLLREIEALNEDARAWGSLPEDMTLWSPFAKNASALERPLSAATVDTYLEATKRRKRRIAVQASLSMAALVAFFVVYAFDVRFVLQSNTIYFLGGACIAVVTSGPTLFKTYAHIEKRETLYRLLAAHYGEA